MSTYEQFRTVAILLPIVFLLALGFSLTLSSMRTTAHGALTFRSVISNFSSTVIRVLVCLILLFGLQQVVGLHHP